MSSLKQRIDAATQSLVHDILELVRTTPVHELERLLSHPGGRPARSAGPASMPSGLPIDDVRAVRRRRGPSKPREERGRAKASRRDAPAARIPQPPRRHAPADHGPSDAFDVTAPELLLVAELQGKAGREAVEAGEPASFIDTTQDVKSATGLFATGEGPRQAPAPAATPPAPANPRATLRPGESLARANAAGIVIRREGRAKRRG
jgi:hypothetical protein